MMWGIYMYFIEGVGVGVRIGVRISGFLSGGVSGTRKILLMLFGLYTYWSICKYTTTVGDCDFLAPDTTTTYIECC